MRKRAARQSELPIPALEQPSAIAVVDPPERSDPVQPATVREAPPQVVIQVDPNVSVGYMHGRFDVMMRGRAVSVAPIEEIRLQVDGKVTSVTSFASPDSAGEAVMPDGTPAHRRLFRFNLTQAEDGNPAHRCPFQIVARVGGGFEHAEDYEIEVDPGADDPVSLLAGPSFATSGSDRPHTVVYIERGTIDQDGIMSVLGWGVSVGTILAVQIFADDHLISKAKIGGEREDIAAIFPDYPNSRLSGFSLTLPLDEDERRADRIRARLVSADGFKHEEMIPVERLEKTAPSRRRNRSEAARLANAGHHAGAADRTPRGDPDGSEPSANIKMFCDVAALTADGVLSLDGWAVCGVGIVRVRVLLNGNEVGLATIGHERTDVGEIFPEIPMAHLSGFRFEQKAGDRFEGEQEICLIVRNMHGEEVEQRIAVVPTGIAAPEPAPDRALLQAPVSPKNSADQAKEFRFELDSPVVSNGAAVALVTGRLTIDGWLLTHSGVESFDVYLDDQRLGEVHYGLARQDVGTAFPEWPNALRSGFAFHCPPRSLRDGEHLVELRIRSTNGQELVRAFEIKVKKADEQNETISIRRRIPRVERDMIAALLADMDHHPRFRFILRQDRLFEAERMRTTLDALRWQAYADWTVLVLAKSDDLAVAMRAEIDDYLPDYSERFSIITSADSGTWSASFGQEGHGQPTFYCPLLPGDEPGADALLELAMASGRHPDRDLLYGDEVRLSPVSHEIEPFFKPDFSPDLLLSTNYIGRPWAATAALLATAGSTPAGLTEGGEYDLLLQCVEAAKGVHHIPKLLCQRAPTELDEAGLEKAALERTLRRRGIAGEVLTTPVHGTWRVKRSVPVQGKVSIIIPTCAAQGYIETCITTLRAKTSYRDFEIICIDNIPQSDVAWKVWLQQNADKIVDIPGTFNWSIFNNRAVEAADGEFLLFLNDDIEIIQDDWLEAMLEHARRPEVGITGPKLLYRDGKVQHAGMFLANNGIGRHAFRFAADDDPCYFGLALTQRNVIAVTGACMLVRRETFDRLGGFDEGHQITNNDLDFCLRAHRAGLLTVYTPYATLTHYELASRAYMKDVFDLTHFNAAWQTTFAAGDPYFNPRLSRHADDYRPDEEPVQWVVSGAPLFLPEEIQRILVVKLDHIGDFVTALPPIRRLKKLFPHARITVLAGPASKAFVALESCIDEFIPFAFFHARSQLGQRELSTEDFADLARQLRPYRFDLAVDLRKHPSTRDVLQHTGARFLAGFDYLGQFPFLDIALDWDGDRTLQRKHSHIVDDLLALVNCIGHAAEADRMVIQPAPPALPLAELRPEVQALFVKPVVAIHPGAGNITKQWPEEHFAALIDLLMEKNDVNVLLVGGIDEVAVAEALLGKVRHPEAIASMAGETSLATLPRLLKNCVLYIGNDSGPKHIAAAVGVPTIGIHSGVVDPVEWGPIGPNAVALRRNMTCSPCYLADAKDCPRALACLRFLEPNLVYETADLLLKRPLRANAAPPVERSPEAGVMPAAAGIADRETSDAVPSGQTRRGKPVHKTKAKAPRHASHSA